MTPFAKDATKTSLGTVDPGIELFFGLHSQRSVEARIDLTRFHELRPARLDCRNDDGLGFGKRILDGLLGAWLDLLAVFALIAAVIGPIAGGKVLGMTFPGRGAPIWMRRWATRCPWAGPVPGALNGAPTPKTHAVPDYISLFSSSAASEGQKTNLIGDMVKASRISL